MRIVMLCCALILALMAAPAWLVGRSLRPERPERTSPLAWRLTGADEAASPTRPRRRIAELIRRRARSFVFAGAGIWHVARNEPNARIHAAATLLALGAGILLGISPHDWRWIAVAIAAVWSAEAFNTAVERACDLLSPGLDERVRIAKDAAAGAVLLVSIGAAVIGLLTFWPYVAAVMPVVAGASGIGASFCAASAAASQ
jgi:diacylglycerol kinase (ATP)